MMKKFLALFFIIITFFQISGCTKQNEKTTIQLATWGAKTQTDTLKLLLNEFEKENTDIKVSLIHIPQNYFQKLHLLVASNLVPDVVLINNINGKLYIDNNVFEPLDAYFDEELKKISFYSTALNSFTLNSNIYAIPRDISNIAIFYNKDIFDKKHIKYPKSDWSLEDLLLISKSLTDKNIFGIGFEKNSIFWLPLVFTHGGGILNSDNNIIINTDKTKKFIQFYSDLRNKYHIAPTIDEQASMTTSQMFLQEKIAMHLCGMWCNGLYKKEANFRYGIVNLPKGEYPLIMDASGYAMSRNSKNKSEAWRLIKFLSSKSSHIKLSDDGLILSARVDIEQKNTDAFTKYLNDTIPTPICANYQEVLDLVNIALEKVFDKNDSVNDNINNELVKKIQRTKER